jgi:DNA gyrase subunit B
MDYSRIHEKMNRKIGANGLLEVLLKELVDRIGENASQLVGEALLNNEEFLAQLAGAVESHGYRSEVLPDHEHSLWELRFSRDGGIPVMFDLDLLLSAEWQQLVQLYLRVLEFTDSDLMIREKERETVVQSPDLLVNHILAAGKRNLSIQRYKGLGEMNPLQLWETTMDPETRVLLQVNIEDAIETDEIFTILMGDQVEPRRRFIEDNALNVKNLDI